MMGGKESTPQQKPKVKILVAGHDPCIATDLINNFVYYHYMRRQHMGITILDPFDTVAVSIDDVSLLLEVKDVSSTGGLHVDTYNRYLKMELTRYPHVGLMLLYNPTTKCSFERVKEIVDIDLPRLLPDSKSTVPVIIVGDECYLRGLRKTEVSYCAAREFANERDIPVVEVYGKDGVNVELAFMTLVGEVVQFKNLV